MTSEFRSKPSSQEWSLCVHDHTSLRSITGGVCALVMGRRPSVLLSGRDWFEHEPAAARLLGGGPGQYFILMVPARVLPHCNSTARKPGIRNSINFSSASQPKTPTVAICARYSKNKLNSQCCCPQTVFECWWCGEIHLFAILQRGFAA